jgi:hypothetical protein
MIRSAVLALILLSVAAPAFAEPPKAVITGKDGEQPPTKMVPGQINLLDSTKSVGDKFSWKVRITPASGSGDLWMTVEDRRKLLMPSLPGTYHVILAVAGDGDPDITEYDLVIDGTTPGPGPVPPGPVPIPPDPAPVSLSAVVSAEVAKVVKPETYADWMRLAEGLDRVAALADSDAAPTVDAFLGMSKAFEDVSLSASASAKTAWAAIKATTITPRLSQLTTVAEYSKSWKEISAGVKTGAGAQPPPPKPPGPTPPGPAPIPVAGLRVLIIEETADRGTLPASQAMIFESSKVLGWLRGNANNNWRVWDKDIDPAAAPVEFRDALKIQRTSLPWIVISNGTTGFSGPLPKTVDETVALLEKYKP